MGRSANIFLCSVIISSLVGAVACQKKDTKTLEEKVFNVQTQDVVQKPLKPFIESIGTLNPFEEVTVSAEIEGVIRSVKVEEGSQVSKGMLLAAIDDSDYSLEVKRADAVFKQAEATLENTRLEFKRKDVLYKEELVTKQQYDDVTTRLSLAEAEVERAKASLSLARLKLSKTKITSPLACVIKEKRVSAGDFVRNGTPLFIIIQPNPLKLRFTVPEKDVGRLRVNQEVMLRVDGFAEAEFKGRVNIVFPNVEEKTRTLQVEALVPNNNGLLKPGLFAKVILYTSGERDTIVVPVTALLYEGEKVRVFVTEGDRAKERVVKLGSKYGEFMEIIEGVKTGEKVVFMGQQNLSEGAKVSIQQITPQRAESDNAGHLTSAERLPQGSGTNKSQETKNEK
ncbi:MAG TPA: efflux RND transporter periplasmic adaptor subunit [Syntrophorhabdus sp.]|nr:efflux RND transporter periplasmic adaptor subunit [Syntrophorhabdus sp.]HQP54681.1 efflux RND transporter periplasmic adaptor subunit [Syntrophorhabdus sp.]